MKKFLSCIKTVIILFAVTILSLGFYAYMLARPVSYGMAYTNSSVYEGVEFEGRMEFYSDATMLTKNSSFNEGFKSYYYYKNGYIFSMMAQTEEEYQKEVENINANFEGAVNTPFYASKINAFELVPVGPDGYTMVYTCTPAIVFAVVGGVVELVLLGVSILALTLYIKAKKEN
jgi:hypothetical protein